MRTGSRLSAIGLAFAALAWGTPASAQFTAHSLAELRNYASTYNGATITLSDTGGDPHPVTGVVRPGVYWINGDHIANPTNSEPIYLELGGNGNTYNLGGARLNLDTRKLDGFGRNLGHGSGVRVVKISGDGNTVNGLSLTGYDLELDTDPTAQRHADWAAVYVQVTGSNNNLLGADVVTRGSTPYGLGDAFGKGASGGVTPFIGHRKTSGLQVLDASNSYFDDIHLDINTFGHGFFVQKSSDTTLENSTVTGELVPSSNVINHPLYQEHGHTHWGNPIPDDIMISAAEDGVRAYGSIDGVSVTNMTVRNVVVTNMRSGFATSLAKGSVLLDSVETYGGEKGFGVGSNHTITNSKGDITNGPLIFFPYDNFKDSTIDVELVGEVPVGVDWSAAYLNGDNLDVTISSSLPAGALPPGSLVRLGQEFFEDWRNGDSPTGPDFPTASDFINSTFINNTNQMLVMGNDVTGNTGTSAAPVISNGKENYYDGITLVPAGVRTVLVHRAGLGNNGNSAEGTLETNASVVSGGGTLELASGIQIGNEKLTISGDGVDGNGALYAGGGGSRFGSSSRSDESIIVLEGSASIGVDGDLIVGSVQGVGDLTKRGSGRLSLEKSNTFIGDLIVTEGEVTVRTGGVNHGLTVSAGATVRPLGSHAYNTEGHAEIDGTLDLNGRTDENTLTQRIGSLSGVGGIISSNTAGTAFGILEISGEDTEATFQGYITGEVSVVKSGNGSQTLAPISGGLDYLGATTVNEGRLLIDGVHSGGGEFQINSGGALGGSGAILSNVTVASGGSLAPGFSAGSLSLSEAELSAGSTLEIELGGTSGGDQHDVLTTIDGLTLGGELVISLLDTGGELFIPASSDIFNIIQSGLPIAGAFANAADGQRVDTLGGEGSFLVNYDTTADSIFLSDFLIAGLTGDYNRDGVVDAADYSVWRDTLGQTGVDPFSGADGNGDGQITPADYAIWTANFGAASAPDAASSVPEPDSLLLLLITCILLKAAIGFRHSL